MSNEPNCWLGLALETVKGCNIIIAKSICSPTEPQPSGRQAEATDLGSAHHMKTHQRRLHLSSLALRQPLPQLPRSRCPHLLSLNSVKCKSIGVVASFSNPSPSHSAPPIQSLIVTNQPCKSSYMWH